MVSNHFAHVAEVLPHNGDLRWKTELANVIAASTRNHYGVRSMIVEAMNKVERKGVVTLEEGKGVENNLRVVEGMQFDCGYTSPYFVSDSEKLVVEYENCKLQLVDEKTTHSRDRVNILEDAIRNGYRILSQRIEQQALDTLVVHKLRGALKVAENLKLMVLVSEKASVLMTKQPFLEVSLTPSKVFLYFIFTRKLNAEIFNLKEAARVLLALHLTTIKITTVHFI
ncbi:chaperonin 60 subunit beta 2, chloroplastic-like [Solanum verrucosum]|uniref:chaperonin 60 subunit beta 2, chloroplastic-like n=1 Tax=Solanum verrucosum TaxID=315347 RepID=UPI0020D0645F|nr:chaperonin 60 subunit beta 2, chloroplastic-like [Solanum verrucosum]